ncbi:MAG: pyridoxamine 5'-phosphate oxidase family protein [Acidimicrobiia bacterium]|nr:pyridoxamine 5'-phosphate oxidase family protein [Acidimicrobiia bacterium]
MARKDITMTHDEQQAFLAQGHTLIVTTIGKDGWPHVAPMWYFLDDEGRVGFRSFTKSQKIVNLVRHPKLTVLLEEGEAYEELRGIMIKGTATLVDDPSHVLGMYGELSRRYAFTGTEVVPLEGDALEAAFGRFAPKNTGVIVQPESVVSWDHRKLAGAY